jgi:hypothetical protein
MLSGRCLCGKVRFEIEGALGPVVMCHCTMCRHASGSAFATNASVGADAFRIVAGRKSVKIFESSEDGIRAFCRKCGSPVFGGSASHPETIRIRLGALEDAGGARPAANIWTGSKAEWFAIGEGLQSFEEAATAEFFAPGESEKKSAKKKAVKEKAAKKKPKPVKSRSRR